MHHAPSVSYPVGRCRFEGSLVALVSLCGGFLLLQWVASGQKILPALMSAWVLLLACGVGGLAWRRSPTGRLIWNEQTWTWACDTGAEQHEAPSVMLDLQFVLLVRSGRCGRWLWLERWREPSAWSDIRRAVYSRAIHAAPRQQPRPTRADAAP